MMNMKKIFFLLAIASFVACTNDDISVISTIEKCTTENPTEFLNSQNNPIVTDQSATEVATAFWADFNNTTRAVVEDLEYDFETIYSEDGPQMYVFNFKDRGFVVVSATKEYYPILAYSEDGTFPIGEEKEGLKMWLDDTKYAISNCDQQADSIIPRSYIHPPR